MNKFLWLLCFFCMVNPAYAHFGMIIPSENIVPDQKHAAMTLVLSFSHPSERTGMDMAKPLACKVAANGQTDNLTADLQPCMVMGKKAWQAKYTLQRPGVYQFIVEPEPYWESAEDCFIIHYTKTYVAAFGESEGWDEPAGLKTEIIPLTRPFGNYAGNVFQGRVLLDGKPVPDAEIEIEFYNSKHSAPNTMMITQSIHADQNGVFTYAVPFAGWWGFAALSKETKKMQHAGTMKDVELGAVIWSYFVDPLPAHE